MNYREPIRVLQIIGMVCGGGVEAVIMNYYRYIDKSKVQFDFIIDGYEKSILDDEITALGGKIYKVEPYKRNVFKYMYQIYRIVRDNEYNIIHSNMNTLAIFSLFPAWLAGAKVRILHNHSTAVKYEKIRSLMKYILRPFAPLFANNYLACSKLAGDWMYGHNFMDSGKVKVINNAIDTESFSFDKNKRERLRNELGIPKNAFVIGHVGRFMYQKNHDYLIEIFYEVYKKNRNAFLLLIGDGELRSVIENKVIKYRLNNSVKFLGLRKDVKYLYNVMDVFVLPSWYEGLPVVAVEAQANGLKCFFSTNVTKEAKLIKTTMFYSLDAGPKYWGRKIAGFLCERNVLAKNEMQEKGFYVKIEAKKLMDYYSSFMEESKYE